ncbi:CHASE3 domain-containing protein [Streptacidiphilus sp. ASG 303]|nr:sensor histidine kinase [Streptacidiphilus sp. ASG 303]MCD0481016.1 CHASE3 domain-containing protein [Streptacidiphilus sp. ASG 303]
MPAWTTRQWLRAGVAAALAVLALLGTLGAWTLARMTTAIGQLADTGSPALVASVRLETALVDQETGIRGYGLSGRREFLQPYTRGLAEEEAAAARLRSLAGGDARARADLDAVLSRAGRWQEGFARPVASAPAGAPVALASERAEAGRAAFDAVRRASADLQRHLRDEQARARADLDHALAVRDWTFSAIAAVVLLLAVLAFEGLRRGVTGPLERVSADARQVAEGRFDRPITPTGPADLRLLAADVEAMRRRLADELSSAEEAGRALDAQAAELRRSNTELEQFAYVASHDLQEPLRKVASFCQLLQRRYGGRLDERADQYIGFAVDGANRMQTLISELLAFSRVGRVHQERAAVDLGAVLAAALDDLGVALEESGAEVGAEALPVVTGDATQLGMLWQNLLSNAVKFRSPERPPRIRVGVERDGGMWRFSVTDNGIGIEPEYAEKVFVIFQRLHTRDAYPGTGIGLALCRKVVEFHGGTIGVDTAHAPGTRVVFTLPADGPPDPG